MKDNKMSKKDIKEEKRKHDEIIAQLSKEKKLLEVKKKKQEKKKRKEAKRKAWEAKQREEYKLIQSTQRSVPIADIMKGVIITTDNRYIKIMEFAPQNFLMFNNFDKNKTIDAFQIMLKAAPNKVQIKTFTTQAKTDLLTRQMKHCMKTEKNEACRRMQAEYINLVENVALTEGVTRRFYVIIEYTPGNEGDERGFDGIVTSLRQSAARIRSALESAGNRYIPSCDKDQGLIEFFYEILNRKTMETQPFSKRVENVYKHYMEEQERLGLAEVPPIPATEFIAPAWIDFTHMNYIVIDNKFYTFGYMEGDTLPDYVYAGWLNGFINSYEGVDVDIFFSKQPRDKIAMDIGRRIRNNRAASTEVSDTSLDARGIQSSIQAGEYFLNGLSGGEDFYYASVLITVAADSLKQLNYMFNEIKESASTIGINIRRTYFEMEKAFESTLPLCRLDKSIERKAKRNMLSSGASSLYPFINQELQDPNGIMIGINSSNNSLVSIDVFDTDKHANANGAILGQSGYGKTFTAQLLAMRMRLQNIQTFIITPLKGREDYKRGCDTIDGQFVSLGPGSPYSINVLDIRVPDTSGLKALDEYDESQDSVSLLAKKVQDLHTFMSLVVDDLSQEEEQILDGYFYKVYAKFGITEDNNSVYIPGTKEYKQFPVLGDLYEEIKDEPVLTRVKNILYPMINGSLSSYNKQTNVDLTNKYIVFDMGGTKGKNLVLSMFITLDFIWGKIKENRLEKKAVFIDEAWQLIGSASNEMTAEYVKEIFKTIRAFGGSAFVMTQEISDFFALKNGEYGKAIIGNADTKICLHLGLNEAAMLRDVIGLENKEFEKITKLDRGHGLVISSGCKLFADFTASDFEVSVITTDPKKLRAQIEKSGEFDEISS